MGMGRPDGPAAVAYHPPSLEQGACQPPGRQQNLQICKTIWIVTQNRAAWHSYQSVGCGLDDIYQFVVNRPADPFAFPPGRAS